MPIDNNKIANQKVIKHMSIGGLTLNIFRS